MSHTLQHIVLFLATSHKIPENTVISEKPKDVLNMLYKVLDTLDGKSSHLLRLNAIVLSTLSILIALTMHTQDTLHVMSKEINPAFIFLGSSLSPLAACSCALWIFRIKWPFLSTGDPAAEFAALGKVCDARHKWHGWVWGLSLLSLALLFVNLLIAAA